MNYIYLNHDTPNQSTLQSTLIRPTTYPLANNHLRPGLFDPKRKFSPQELVYNLTILICVNLNYFEPLHEDYVDAVIVIGCTVWEGFGSCPADEDLGAVWPSLLMEAMDRGVEYRLQ
jgi:hypothetical protein